MRSNGLTLILVMAVIFVGCSTTRSPLFSHEDKFQFSGREALGRIDPGAKVDPSQAGVLGINGPSGSYAAVIAAASIYDPLARTEALEAIKTISDNESYGFGRHGRVGRGGWSTLDQPQEGALVNRSDVTRVLEFRDHYTDESVIGPIEIPARRYVRAPALPGTYKVVVSGFGPDGMTMLEIKNEEFEINERPRDCSFYPPGATKSIRVDWVYAIV